jgi:hypothetical protein
MMISEEKLDKRDMGLLNDALMSVLDSTVEVCPLVGS